MLSWFIGIILTVLLVFLSVVIFRAVMFRPKEMVKPAGTEVFLEEDKIVNNMSELIRCKTVSYNDKALINYEEYEKFQELLVKLYPEVHKTCSREFVGDTGMLYYWKGKTSKDPVVCMSHYDVVPIEEEQWSKPAFEGIVENGELWGRGTLDTKGTFCGIMEAAESLIKSGFVPEHDIYFSFSGDEEIFGPSCPAIVNLLKERKIKPALVVDEGGAVVENVFPGVKKECALIGIAEKGSVNVKFSAKSQGGHSSMPPVHTLVGELAQAVVQVENHPFPMQYTKPVREMFDVLGRYSGLVYRILFANMWCFKGVFDRVCKKAGGELNAMMRTTCAMTKMDASKAYNVIPPTASVGMNLRLLGKDTMESAKAYLKQVIKNDNIEVEIVGGNNPSIDSNTDCKEWERLKQAVVDTWPEAIVAPYLMMAGSDSRHYCNITDRVYRFSAMKLSKEERGMIHGNDERVPIATLVKTVEFYVRLLRMC